MEQLRSYWRVGVVVLAACAVSWQDLAAEEVYCLTEPSGCCDDFCLPCPAPVRPRSPWYFQADALILRRDVAGSTAAATRNTPTQTVLSTWDLDEPFKAGARCLIGRTWGGDSPLQIEVSYFALAPWDSRAALRDTTANTLGGQGNLFSPFTHFGSPAIDSVDYNTFASIRERSEFDGASLDLVYHVPMAPSALSVACLVGVRYLQVDEQFDYFSQQAASPAPLGATNSVSTGADNELWGPQLGGIARFYAGGSWWIDVGIKGAICNNSASQQTSYVHVDRLGVSQAYAHSRSADVTTYVGDLDLTLVHRWSPLLTTRIGYQAMWLDGLALASENFHPSVETLTLGPGQLITTGKAIYHGIHAGIELNW